MSVGVNVIMIIANRCSSNVNTRADQDGAIWIRRKKNVKCKMMKGKRRRRERRGRRKGKGKLEKKKKEKKGRNDY